jgi:hypothetical protein
MSFQVIGCDLMSQLRYELERCQSQKGFDREVRFERDPEASICDLAEQVSQRINGNEAVINFKAIVSAEALDTSSRIIKGWQKKQNVFLGMKAFQHLAISVGRILVSNATPALVPH